MLGEVCSSGKASHLKIAQVEALGILILKITWGLAYFIFPNFFKLKIFFYWDIAD